jgi:hypothetical protein
MKGARHFAEDGNGKYRVVVRPNVGSDGGRPVDAPQKPKAMAAIRASRLTKSNLHGQDAEKQVGSAAALPEAERDMMGTLGTARYAPRPSEVMVSKPNRGDSHSPRAARGHV